jgi:hypothetical protein
MKVLIDECAPRALKSVLSKHEHESLTVQEAGWSGKQNGELLAEAETEFDVLVTVDTNLNWQDADSPLWFSNHPPIALNTGSTFRPLLWPSRRSRLGRSFRSASLTDPCDANSNAQNAYRPRVRLWLTKIPCSLRQMPFPEANLEAQAIRGRARVWRTKFAEALVCKEAQFGDRSQSKTELRKV